MGLDDGLEPGVGLVDADARSWNYYGWGYYGAGVINGESKDPQYDAVDAITGSHISSEYDADKKFDFIITGVTTGTSPHSCDINVTATALADLSGGTFILHVAVIETSVDYEGLYGKKTTNGQSVLNNLLRQLLPDTNGTNIGPQTVGRENTVDVSYTVEEQYQNYENLRVVAFVQNNSDKEVIDVFQSADHPFQDTPIQKPVLHANRQLCKIISADKNSIRFSIPADGIYSVELFNSNGKKLYFLSEKFSHNSINSVDWNLPVAEGSYIVRFTGNNLKYAEKVLIVK